jgi:iron complex outermembrane receptor protein
LDAEVYDGITTPGKIQRDRFQVSHNQNQFGNIVDATQKNTLFGLNNKTTVGADYTHIDFERRRGFPNGDSVDLFNPTPGFYGTSDFARRSPTKIETVAAFAEDALNLTNDLKLVTGLRYENFNLNRQNFNADGSFDPTTSFERDFHPFNYRAGLIYDVTPTVSLYGQYTTAQDPSGGNNIFLVNGNQNFDMSSSREAEVGVKANYDAERGRALLSFYDIERKNILTQVSVDTVETVGSQKSRGVELSSDYRVTEKWTVGGNASYTYARFGSFSDANGNYSGKRPANVPDWIGNLWTRYANVWNSRFDLGGSFQYVGSYVGDFANTLRLDDYTLLNLFTTYHVVENVDLTFRVNNVMDTAYVRWADTSYSATEVQLGAPRSYFATLRARF